MSISLYLPVSPYISPYLRGLLLLHEHLLVLAEQQLLLHLLLLQELLLHQHRLLLLHRAC